MMADLERWLGISRDVVSAGSTGADVGFNIARRSTKWGFGVATDILNGLSQIGNQTFPLNPVSAVLSGVSGVVYVSGKIADCSLQTSHKITKASLGVSSEILGACGAKDGELLKAIGFTSDTVNSLLLVAKLINSFGQDLHITPRLIDDLGIIASLQSLAGMKVTPTNEKHTEQAENGGREIMTFIPFAMAIYGKGVSSMLGLENHIQCKEDVIGVATDNTDVIIKMCKINRDDIIIYKAETSPYDPSFFITLDRKVNSVVVTFRGTLSLSDVFTDLLCEHEPCTIFGTEGKVHHGFRETARRLAPRLEPLIWQGMSRLDPQSELPLSLIVTGHSLGAAVATTLTAHWLDSGSFNGIQLRCYAYGAPCVFSYPLASHIALREAITSVVLGDDLVPRLCHGSAFDLRGRILRLQDLRTNAPQEYNNLLDIVKAGVIPKSNAVALYSLLEPDEEPEERLYPAGTVYYTNPFEENEHAQRVLKPLPRSQLADLLLSPNMFSDHMPQQYFKLYALYESGNETDLDFIFNLN